LRAFLRRFLRSRRGVVGLVLIAAIALAAIAAPLLFPGDPLDIVGRPLLAPFADGRFPLGTDRLGRDVAAGLVHGARISVGIGLVAALASLVVGIVIGTTAGFLGGRIDEALMRLTEAVQTVPSFILALALVSLLGPSLHSIVLAIAIGSWTAPARLVRAEILSLRARDFVDSCRVVGMGWAEIAFRQLLPNALPPVVALAGIMVAAAILIESALAFLGLSDPNVVSWGSMVAGGRAVLRSAAWLVAIPGAAIAVTVLAVALVGDGIADALAARRGIRL
jgi:peptide/nickel transport system permease protein